MQRASLAAAGPTGLVALAALAAACDTAEDRSAAWGYVHTAIIRPSCATAACHSHLSSAGGLDLGSPDHAYTFLTGRVCGAPPHDGDPIGNFVRPGQPESSQLLWMLRGEGTSLVMPPDTPLPDVEIAIIERWILEGAACD
ncbi:MAG: hypothetical protein K8M05_17915 [Deltaproteobacteria bacterium]|nr:hypothetical protein [Kofleriaceae bacterium]